MRKINNSMSIFYRGISLKEFVQKTAKIYTDFNYKDEDTILVDQHLQPVEINDSFIYIEKNSSSRRQSRKKPRLQYKIDSKGRVYQLQSQCLPSIYAKKTSNLKGKPLKSQRLSTNVSIQSLLQMRNDSKRYEKIQESPKKLSIPLSKRHIKSLPSKEKLHSEQDIQANCGLSMIQKRDSKVIDYNQFIHSDVYNKEIGRYRPKVICRKAISYVSDKYKHNLKMKLQ